MKKIKKPARITLHLWHGVIDRIKSRGLKHPVELKIFDHDVQTTDGLHGYEIYLYCLGEKSSKKKAR